jgi:Fe-S cluster assembly protein SufD
MIVVQDKGIQERLIVGNKHAVQSELKQRPTKKERAALKKMDDLTLPTIRDEDWRYANLDFLLKADFEKDISAAHRGNDATLIDQIKTTFPSSSIIVIENGVYSSQLSQISSKDIHLTTSQNNKEPFSDQFEHLENSFFYYLNQSNPSSNLTLEIKGNDSKSAPLQIIHMDHFSPVANFPILQPSITIRVSSNSEASILEHYAGGQAIPLFRNSVTQITLEENSVLNYQKIQNEGKNAHGLSNTFVYQAAGSQFSHGSYLLGSAWSRNSTQVSYSGKNTLTNLYGIAIGTQEQYLDHSIKLNHTNSHADSRQLFKYVLSDKSRGVFNGKILVQKNASALNAQQNNHNLLLSDSAEMNAKPHLEISNEDVKCSHGSTIGQLDENALFYMRARGISSEKAKSMLTEAFVTEVLENMTNKSTINYVKNIIQQKLNR